MGVDRTLLRPAVTHARARALFPALIPIYFAMSVAAESSSVQVSPSPSRDEGTATVAAQTPTPASPAPPVRPSPQLSSGLPPCGRCFSLDRPRALCSQCKTCAYCKPPATCQRLDWPTHKKVCGLDAKAKAGPTPTPTTTATTTTTAAAAVVATAPGPDGGEDESPNGLPDADAYSRATPARKAADVALTRLSQSLAGRSAVAVAAASDAWVSAAFKALPEETQVRVTAEEGRLGHPLVCPGETPEAAFMRYLATDTTGGARKLLDVDLHIKFRARHDYAVEFAETNALAILNSHARRVLAGEPCSERIPGDERLRPVMWRVLRSVDVAYTATRHTEYKAGRLRQLGAPALPESALAAMGKNRRKWINHKTVDAAQPEDIRKARSALDIQCFGVEDITCKLAAGLDRSCRQIYEEAAPSDLVLLLQSAAIEDQTVTACVARYSGFTAADWATVVALACGATPAHIAATPAPAAAAAAVASTGSAAPTCVPAHDVVTGADPHEAARAILRAHRVPFPDFS